MPLPSPTRLRFLALTLCAAVALTGCQVAPGTGKQGFNLLSAQDEQQMGAEEHPDVMKSFGGAYGDAELQFYVARIGSQLVRVSETPDQSFTFTVLNSDIVNAMALPGGYVYVTRGLLALVDNEAELAGVIAHEIGHVTARHTAERYSQAMAANIGLTVLGVVVGSPEVAQLAGYGAQAYLQSFSRDQELEADTLGVRYLSRAGYDANAMAAFLKKLHQYAALEARMAGRPADSVDETSIMATHPRTLDRVQQAIQAALNAPAQGRTDAEPYLRHIDGLVYGGDPAKGIVRGTMFLHPQMRFQFSVPPGFVLANGDEAVTAANKQGAVISFTAQPGRAAGIVGYLQNDWARRVRLDGLEAIEINGMPAATGATRINTKRGWMDVRLVAVQGPAMIYRFMFVTPPELTAPLAEDLKRTTYSLRSLTPEEAARIRPDRLRIRPVRPGDSAESLSGSQSFDDLRYDRFLVLNGLEPGANLRPGSLVKVVGE